MTTPAFNLIEQSWLPVRRRSGKIEHIAPFQINDRIAQDPFVAFAWPRPDFNGATHEFLIGLLSTASAPSDEDEWGKWWSKPPKPKVLKQRFAEVADAFNLDGPAPRFLQDPSICKEKADFATERLLIDAPGKQTLDHNADLFVKRGGVPVLCRAAAAIALYTLNTYAPSGGSGHRTSLRGGGPMTTLVIARHAAGDTLWGRLWPNVESEEQIENRQTGNQSRDDHPSSIFPWLAPVRVSDRKNNGKETTPDDVHPLQVYWGMPRRIWLEFKDAANDQPCGLIGARDAIVTANYRTKPHGVDYSEGFEHPLTPYYYKKQKDTTKMPVHPNPGGLSYRLWPGLVVKSDDQLHDPAQAIRHWNNDRKWHEPRRDNLRFAAFGYDMDNMKARAWIEGEMPLWAARDKSLHEHVEFFICHAPKGADRVTRLLENRVKQALYERPKDAPGDYGFIKERFYRETEKEFYTALNEAIRLVEKESDSNDPTAQARKNWLQVMKKAALRLFDTYAPADGLEDRNMHRHAKASFSLRLALDGYGKDGQGLFSALEIQLPETHRQTRKR